jgi:hypothetical protein
LGEGPRESEVVVMKERRLVPIEPVYEGIARFSFLLETCAPGSVPDPPLIAGNSKCKSFALKYIYIYFIIFIHSQVPH